jgi:hypothetical protein
MRARIARLLLVTLAFALIATTDVALARGGGEGGGHGGEGGGGSRGISGGGGGGSGSSTLDPMQALWAVGIATCVVLLFVWCWLRWRPR